MSSRLGQGAGAGTGVDGGGCGGGSRGGGGRCPNTCPLLLAYSISRNQLKMELVGAHNTSRCDFRILFLFPKAFRAAAGGVWRWHRRCMRRSNACNEIRAAWKEAAGMWLSTDVKAIEIGARE